MKPFDDPLLQAPADRARELIEGDALGVTPTTT